MERSQGRRYPELPHAYRNEFQRDRDRVIHARAFRRLEDKTQVFTAGISDHFRNRLTHTIEVSQIARTIAAVLQVEEEGQLCMMSATGWPKLVLTYAVTYPVCPAGSPP